MNLWKDFDIDEVHEDLVTIAELGLDVVRIFLLWEDFQPEPTTVRCSALSHLVQFCDAASAEGLKLDITFFTGHMSGPNWAPLWLLAPGSPPYAGRPVMSQGTLCHCGYRNPFSDPIACQASRKLVHAIAKTLGDHSALWAYNLGNEPDLFGHPTDALSGRNWLCSLVSEIRELDPVHPITCGLHFASLEQDNGFRVDQVFDVADFAVMHAYPMYTSLARSPLDPEFVPFTCALTAALSGKPCLMEEWGGCTAPPGMDSMYIKVTATGREQFLASEEALADYVEAVLNGLLEVGATGAFLWCFADYAPELWKDCPCDRFEHERWFGLLRADGSLKPHAKRLQEFSSKKQQAQPQQRKMIWRPALSAAEFYRAPREQLDTLYTQFLQR